MNNNKIWRSYWKPEQKNDYNLIETDNTVIYNTNDKSDYAHNKFNDLNEYLGELPMMYYIWKNNLKSEIIGISQYRRHFINYDIYRILKNEIEIFDYCPKKITTIYNSCVTDWLLIQYEHYLKNKYNIDKSYIYKYKYKTFWKIMFICKWDIYCEICDFIFGFLDYIMGDNNWQYKNKIIKFIRMLDVESLKNKTDTDLYNLYYYWYKIDNRTLPVIIEHLLPHFLSIKYNFYLTYRNITLITIIENNDDAKYLDKFIKYNIGNICPNYILIIDKHNLIDNEIRNMYFNTYDNSKVIINNDYTNIIDPANNIYSNMKYYEMFVPIDSFIKYKYYNVDYRNLEIQKIDS